LYKEYPDVPLNLIENVLYKRDDLQNAQVKEIMEQCHQKAKEEKEKDVEAKEITTVFSKLSI